MPNATIVARTPVGGGMHRVALSLDAEVASSHARHGQYVELRHEFPAVDPEATIPMAVRGYFVLASSPGASRWEVLAQEGGAMADRLVELPIGAVVATSSAQGRGYPFEEARGRALLFAVTGSGIAAALSALRARIAEGEAQRTFLLYGVRTRKDVALEQELAELRAAGIWTAVCLSREEPSEPGFHRGYVPRTGVSLALPLEGGLAFAAGRKEMILGMKQEARALGLRPEDIRLNQ